ncbi:MAG: phosphopantetheine-binding protein [Tannerella sp.]|jgi:acyl carrier protein|nr:phosphopantetheine-binding protein [Tannerella sp.]
MKNTELIDKINNELANEFEIDVEQIKAEASLIETLELDSLALVDIVVLLEQKFKISIKSEDFIGIKTFQDFYNLIIIKKAL